MGERDLERSSNLVALCASAKSKDEKSIKERNDWHGLGALRKDKNHSSRGDKLLLGIKLLL